jgi:hypothetical protein
MVRLSLASVVIKFDRNSLDISYLLESVGSMLLFTQIDYRPYYRDLPVEAYIPKEISDYVKINKDASVLYFLTFYIYNGFVGLDW